MFASIAQFAVQRRWMIVAGWVVLTIGAVLTLPSLGSVIRNDNTAFLPSTAPSVRAAKLAAPFLNGGQLSGTIVAVSENGPLTAADQQAFSQIEIEARSSPDVISVHDGAVSVDDRARTALVEFSTHTAGGGPAGATAMADIRSAFASSPPQLAFYLTGPLPKLVDQQHTANQTASHVQLLSALLIFVLLAIAFRSFLAPLVALVPAGLALALAGPLIAESTRLGTRVSSLMQLLLAALVLGAGTDYSLFTIFRYREFLRQGLEPHHAIVAAVSRVGKSVTFSAITVIAALLSLLLASFGLYRGVGPGLALGIFVVLVIEMTFLPALLAILGRTVFFPRRPAAESGTEGALGTGGSPGRWAPGRRSRHGDLGPIGLGGLARFLRPLQDSTPVASLRAQIPRSERPCSRTISAQPPWPARTWSSAYRAPSGTIPTSSARESRS